MNEKLLLVKSAVLLYRESLLPPKAKEDGARELIRKALEQIKKTEMNIGVTREVNILSSIKDEVMEMINNPLDYVYLVEDLTQRFKLLSGDDENIYEAFYDGFNTPLDEFKLKQSILNDKRSLMLFSRAEELAKVVTTTYGEFLHNRDKIKDVGKWVDELREKLEPYRMRVDDHDPAIADEFDVENEEEVARVATAMAEEISGELGFKFGWQDINDMINGILRRGECMVIPAMQHNYKTGFSLSWFIHACMFNTPKMIDETKKPLMVRISFEDSTTLNLQFIYKYLYENETGLVIDELDVAKVDPKVIASYVKEKLLATGFNIKLLNVDPMSWTLSDLFSKIEEYEAAGYEVQMCMVDYLPKMPTTGCVGNNGSEEYRNMLERARQFFRKKKCTFITPWQISPAAKEMLRNDVTDFVKKLPGRGFYAGSAQIDQVMDVEIFIHKEVYKNVAYLTVQAGKLRRIVKPSDDKTYRVYKFVPQGCIPWDLNKPNTARLKLGGEMLSDISTTDDNWDH